MADGLLLVIRLRGRLMPGPRMLLSALFVIVSFGSGLGLGLRRQMPRRRMRRSAGLVFVSFSVGLSLGQSGRVCHSARS
jgi:hypothetical protein